MTHIAMMTTIMKKVMPFGDTHVYYNYGVTVMPPVDTHVYYNDQSGTRGAKTHHRLDLMSCTARQTNRANLGLIQKSVTMCGQLGEWRGRGVEGLGGVEGLRLSGKVGRVEGLGGMKGLGGEEGLEEREGWESGRAGRAGRSGLGLGEWEGWESRRAGRSRRAGGMAGLGE